MNKREKQKADTLADIMKYAEELFVKQGYENTSVNQIVKACGMTKGGFYHHFNSKEEVLEKMLHDHYDSILSAVDKFRYDRNIHWMKRVQMITAAARNLGISRKGFVREYFKIRHDKGNLVLKKRMQDYDRKMYVEVIAPLLQEARDIGDCSFPVKPEIIAIFICKLDITVTEEINRVFQELSDKAALQKIDDILDGFAFSIEKLLGLNPETVKNLLKLEESKEFYHQTLSKES